MSEYQNVVIVGASITGRNAVNALVPYLPGTHRIILIDSKEFAYWPVGALRASVVEGFEKTTAIPLTNRTVFPEGSQHQVLVPYKVIELREKSVVLDREFEGSTELSFSQCILATGSSQPNPMRPSEDSTSMSSLFENFKKTQQDIKKAQQIVIIGGGSVGVEMAGEIRAVYPDKKITLVHNSPHLLHPKSTPAPGSNKETTSYSSPPTVVKLSIALEKQLKEYKVDLVLDDRVEVPSRGARLSEGAWDGTFGLLNGVKTVKTSQGKTLNADYVFISIGNKPNTSLVASAYPSSLDSKGLIKIDDGMRAKGLPKGYFAAGDCADVKGWKTAVAAGNEGPAVANNVLLDIKGKALKKFSPGSLAFMMVPLGPAKGAGSITLPYLGTFVVGAGMVSSIKGKTMLTDTFYDLFKGPDAPTAVAAAKA